MQIYILTTCITKSMLWTFVWAILSYLIVYYYNRRYSVHGYAMYSIKKRRHLLFKFSFLSNKTCFIKYTLWPT